MYIFKFKSKVLKEYYNLFKLFFLYRRYKGSSFLCFTMSKWLASTMFLVTLLNYYCKNVSIGEFLKICHNLYDVISVFPFLKCASETNHNSFYVEFLNESHEWIITSVYDRTHAVISTKTAFRTSSYYPYRNGMILESRQIFIFDVWLIH